MPSYVVARGPRAVAAYQRAKATGKTLDRRVKVLLIGQDRVGKTSVGRSLKGEPFRANETSTDGVQMHEPLKILELAHGSILSCSKKQLHTITNVQNILVRELLAEAKGRRDKSVRRVYQNIPETYQKTKTNQPT